MNTGEQCSEYKVFLFQEGYTNADPSQFAPLLCIIKQQQASGLMENCIKYSVGVITNYFNMPTLLMHNFHGAL